MSYRRRSAGMAQAELRPAMLADAEAIAALDALVNASPWSATAIRDTLQRATGFVMCTPPATLVGFVLFSLAADECEILDIAVDPRCRRAGNARKLIEATLAAAAAAGAGRCFLDVRESNASAQAFYHATGFAVVGRRRSYYRTATGTREDALLMSRIIAREKEACRS